MLRIPSQSGRRGCRTRRAVVFCWIACGHSCPIGEHWQLSQVTHSRRLREENWVPLGTANAKGCSLRSCTLKSWSNSYCECRTGAETCRFGEDSFTHVAAAPDIPDHPSASLGPGELPALTRSGGTRAFRPMRMLKPVPLQRSALSAMTSGDQGTMVSNQ